MCIPKILGSSFFTNFSIAQKKKYFFKTEKYLQHRIKIIAKLVLYQR